MMRIHFPLRAANIGREKLLLPRLIAALISTFDYFPNTAAIGHRSRMTIACVQGSKQQKQAKHFDRSHEGAS